MMEMFRSIIDRIKIFQNGNEVIFAFESKSNDEKKFVKSLLLFQKDFLESMRKDVKVEIIEEENFLAIKYIMNSEEEARFLFLNLKSFFDVFNDSSL